MKVLYSFVFVLFLLQQLRTLELFKYSPFFWQNPVLYESFCQVEVVTVMWPQNCLAVGHLNE